MILKVPKGEDPYTVIGNYIRDNVKAIEDMIATIEINGSRINELFEAYPTEEGYFMWESDWWEGEEDVALIDFFPVSEACNPKTSISMEVLNKINELSLEGYTVCFKFHSGDCVGIEMTYDRSYHANHMLTNLDDIKPEHMSDCIMAILNGLKHKIEYLKEYLEKEHGSD